jgi:hypothetical protein
MEEQKQGAVRAKKAEPEPVPEPVLSLSKGPGFSIWGAIYSGYRSSWIAWRATARLNPTASSGVNLVSRRKMAN